MSKCEGPTEHKPCGSDDDISECLKHSLVQGQVCRQSPEWLLACPHCLYVNSLLLTMIFQNVWNTPWCKVKCVGNLLNGYSRVLTAFTWTAFYSPVFACLFVCFFFLPLEFLNVELLRRKLLLPSGSPLHRMVQWQESAFYRSAIMLNADLLNTMLLLDEGANAWVRKRRIWIRF